MAEVVPSLNNLRDEINRIAPNRDKSSDGGIGDDAHKTRPSGHNPDESATPEDHDADSRDDIRARDFDKDLRRPGLTMEMIAQYLVRECRAGRITWIKYIIFNRRIWSASTGFALRAYSGSNPHDKHMHVSSKPDTASENNTRPLGLASLIEEPDVDLDDKYGDKLWPNRTVRDALRDLMADRDVLRGEANAPKPKPGSPLAGLVAVAADYSRLKAEVATLTALARGEQAEVPPSADAVAARVVALLTDMPEVVVNVTPEALQEAIVGAVHEISAPREETP